MFEDLLTLARLDALEESLPVEDVELAPIIAECIDRVRSAARARRIYFEVFVPVGQRAIANRDALAHVVGNLINNAVKYSHEEGLVTVRAQRRDPFVLVEVIDVGLGIDPIHHERIYQRFYRVDRGRSRAAGGTGLGLAIVKKLVDKMGCAIEVRSRPGHGSVFRLLLPRARAEVEPVPPPSAG
jgi:signal transduction histidine kinase